MSVILRKRKLADGRQSLFLDIHVKGVRTKEYLQIYLNPKSKDATDRELNKINLATAESTRAKREISIHADEYEVLPAFKRNAKFNDYFMKYANEMAVEKDRLALSSYNFFLNFVENQTVTFKHITEKFAEDFKEFLLNHKSLEGATPKLYFTQFKKVVKKAFKEKLLKNNPAEDIRIGITQAINKDVLTMAEIARLYEARCGNDNIKRAFLFSCLTGLRLCDIRRLTWGHIKETKEGLMIEMKQKKTGGNVKVNLNANAVQLIGPRLLNKSLIFTLKSHSSILGVLRTWAKRAGINKHITYHVARHSFGTNLIYYGTDVKTASLLLGHSSLAYTSLYLHISDSMKQDGVNNLPSIKS